MSYKANIIGECVANTNFREVIFTGLLSQLVVMEIPPGGDIGEETHTHVEQTLFFHSGSGKAYLDGKEHDVIPGDVVVVTPGTRHNIVNAGVDPLKIYTVYAPANHIDGRVHLTKRDAELDTEDEAFGNRVT